MPSYQHLYLPSLTYNGQQLIDRTSVVAIGADQNATHPCTIISLSAARYTPPQNLVDSHCKHCHYDRYHTHQLDKDVE